MQPLEFYTDYRKYLDDFYTSKKSKSRSFSYRGFCLRAGIKSPSLYKEVVSGKRNLTLAAIALFIKGMGLSERDAHYFENLVLFNQAKGEKEKQRYMAALRGLRYRKPQKIIPFHLHEYYAKWHHCVVRELVAVLPWKENYARLAKSITPPIKASEARASVQLMLQLGFLKRDNRGRYTQTDPDISTGSEVNSLAVRQLNREFAKLGTEAIDRFPPAERDVSSLVMGIPKHKLPQLKNEIADFRRRLITLIDVQDPVESIYGLVIEFFPLAHFDSKEIAEEAKDE